MEHTADKVINWSYINRWWGESANHRYSDKDWTGDTAKQMLNQYRTTTFVVPPPNRLSYEYSPDSVAYWNDMSNFLLVFSVMFTISFRSYWIDVYFRVPVYCLKDANNQSVSLLKVLHVLYLTRYPIHFYESDFCFSSHLSNVELYSASSRWRWFSRLYDSRAVTFLRLYNLMEINVFQFAGKGDCWSYKCFSFYSVVIADDFFSSKGPSF